MVEINKEDFMRTAAEIREWRSRHEDTRPTFQDELHKLGLDEEAEARIAKQVREITDMWMKGRHNG